jgi:membrane fusion protein, protease secretion system
MKSRHSTSAASIPNAELPDADAPPADGRSIARAGLLTLAMGFGGFVLWAGMAPLDEGVPSSALVALDTKRKAVQHLSGGIVKQVMVREGDLVTEGQTVVELDGAVTRANYESVRQRYLGLRAMHDRLLAEQQGSPDISFHADLQDAADDPWIKSQLLTQEQLFRSRQALLRAELRGIEESILGQQSQQEAYQRMMTGRRMQQDLLVDELEHTRSLVSDGYAPRNRQLELERALVENMTSIAELQGNIQRTMRSVAELRQHAIVSRQTYRKELESQLTEVAREVQSDAEKFVAVKAELGRTEIKAPASGQVVGLSVQTVGGVVQPGQVLMDIVPEGEPLLLEARIAPHLIDKVHTGLLADVRFTAFAHSPQLVVEGEIASISKDLLTDQKSGMSYYLARVVVTPTGMDALGQRRLQPGMPAEVVIKTGERSLLTYMLDPLVKRVAASMKEE